MPAAAGRTALNWPAPAKRQARPARMFKARMGSSPARVTELKMAPRFMGSAP